MQGIIREKQIAGSKPETTLPHQLAHVLASGVECKHGCIVLREMPAPAYEALRDTVIDRTGYECFVNHLHFVQPNAITGLCQAEDFCRRITLLLRQADAVSDFRFIISHCGGDWTVRFHAIRSGENWVSEDVDAYAEEALMVMDAVELSPVSR